MVSQGFGNGFPQGSRGVVVATSRRTPPHSQTLFHFLRLKRLRRNFLLQTRPRLLEECIWEHSRLQHTRRGNRRRSVREAMYESAWLNIPKVHHSERCLWHRAHVLETYPGPYAGFLKGGFDNVFGKLLIMRCNLNYTCTVKWQRNHAFRLPGPAPALLKWGGREAGCRTRV